MIYGQNAWHTALIIMKTVVGMRASRMGSCLERTEIPRWFLTYTVNKQQRSEPFQYRWNILTKLAGHWEHTALAQFTSGLKHKHTKLIIMTFWFLIREQNALWMKPPEFSRKSPVLYAFMVWPHPLNNFCSSSTVKGVTSKWYSAGYMWCWAPGAHCTSSPLP